MAAVVASGRISYNHLDDPKRIDSAKKFCRRITLVRPVDWEFVGSRRPCYQQLSLYRPEFRRAGQGTRPGMAGPLPHTIVIAPGGKIVYRKTGILDPNELYGKLLELLTTYY